MVTGILYTYCEFVSVGGDMAGDSSEVQSPLPVSNKGSRTTSPLMTSGGIITKRAGPLVEQVSLLVLIKL